MRVFWFVRGKRSSVGKRFFDMSTTLDYYNRNAKNYAGSTVGVNMESLYSFFLKHLKPNAHILDLGCGSGRDSKYFLDKGYSVDAVDGSEELCKISSTLLNHPVRNLLFQDLDYQENYDAVWACASLLHIPKNDLSEVFHKIYKALKPSGILYVSFKYGIFSGMRNDRAFTDLNESGLQEILNAEEFQILETLVTNDVRQDCLDEKWLNTMLKKV